VRKAPVAPVIVPPAPATIELASLLGKKVELFGVCGNVFKIRLIDEDKLLYLEALEDDNDGNRSALDRVILHPMQPGNTTFPDQSIGQVTVTQAGDIEGWNFVDSNLHAWLSIGTDCGDSYYPCFIFRWELPPVPKTIPHKRIKPYDPFDL
jgi:hypothetical protein